MSDVEIANDALNLGDGNSWADLKERLAAYRRPSTWHSAGQLCLTLALFGLCWFASWYSLRIGYWLTLLFTLPAALMAVRLFILQHDCGHGSLFISRKVNQLVGIGLSTITMTPYECWRRQHALHHATNANLDLRGVGDIWTWTLAEYAAASPSSRLRYRLYRHPMILFGIGPTFHFCLLQRLPSMLPKDWRRERRSIWLTNGLVAITVIVLALLFGFRDLLMVHVPICVMASSIGVALFYLQHQFEHTYWEHDETWNHQQAALEGSSYLQLPPVLQWATANIGFHHVHHLDSRIPYYALARCFNEHSELQKGARMTLRSAICCFSLKIWDEKRRQLLTLAEAKARITETNLNAAIPA